MKNDGQRLLGGGTRSGARSNGFFSRRTISSYLRIVSSGASAVASTVRSTGASVASSIVDREDHAGCDQVQWAEFDKLECDADIFRQVLLLGYRSGFQVWGIEEANDVHELVSRHDGPVSFLKMQPRPSASKRSVDKFVDVRPLLVVVGDGGGNFQDGLMSPCIGNDSSCNEPGNRNFGLTVVRFYSLRSHSYVHAIKFRTAVHSVRCSSRVVAISQAAQIHCFDAATLEKEYTILTHPIASGCLGTGANDYGTLALSPRWLAYAGNPVAVTNTGRVSAEHLTSTSSLSTPPNGSLVAHYAKESSKQLAASIVTLGDMGYKKLSRYCSERNNSLRAGNPNAKANGFVNGESPDAENAGMVVIRDIVSKCVVTQFRAHRSPIASLCFDPSGMLLVTASVQGHNINVFRIVPAPLRGSSGYDASGSYVHLYSLQRGITNAVIQDISFSDDSQWIMISSSRGTSHLFAISPYGGTTDLPTNSASFSNSMNGLNLTNKQAVRWLPSSDASIPNQQTLCTLGPPVMLSVVSRIKNGSNGWRGAVSGAAAAATGRVSSLSGAIASAFLNCKEKSAYPDNSSMRAKQHLLVFSPSGRVIKYALCLSTGVNSGTDLSGSSTISCGTSQDTDVRIVVEPLQKWDVSQRSDREQEDNADIYGVAGSGDNAKMFPKGVKRSSSVYPTSGGMAGDVKHRAEEMRQLYISEAELHVHTACVPLWAKPEICFQAMKMDGIMTDIGDALGGEIEVESFPIRMIEVQSKSLVPVVDHLRTTTFQQSRMSSLNNDRNGPLLHQESEISEDKKCSCHSSCRSPYNLFDGDVVAEFHNGNCETCWDGTRALTELATDSVNIRDNTKLATHFEHVNSRENLKMDTQLDFVNNRKSVMMGSLFMNNDNEPD